ncbi:MAG TPA: amidase [Kofleriaceae bacterium]|nr:amidase [Kofleriaceae bacterium]
MEIDRRSLFRAGAATLIVGCRGSVQEAPKEPYTPPPVQPLSEPLADGVGLTNLPHPELAEVSITDLVGQLTRGELTSVALLQRYRERIAVLDDKLHSILELNREAEQIAERLDRERAAGTVRGPLHGIPILLKDNIDTGDTMLTTAGSLALANTPPARRDAFAVGKLRAAGAIILGKANLSEWANFRGTASCSGWSGRGGQCRNPYALDRSPSGSSSGPAVATAAGLCAAGIGSETDGSIVSPANCNALVGVKPTIGLVSRSGVIPIAPSQDTLGPLTRSVSDAAILLTALAGTDPEDPVTITARPEDYTKYLDRNALRGARIGVPRKGWFGVARYVDTITAAAIDTLKSLGAEIVDNLEFDVPPALGGAELTVLICEIKSAMEAYLERRGDPKVRSLFDVMLYNVQNRANELRIYGHEWFEKAQVSLGMQSPGYREARALCLALARDKLLDGTLQKERLDAIVCGTGGVAGLIDPVAGDMGTRGPDSTTLPAVAGYPHITVPAGWYHGLPVGLSFMGGAFTEGKLLGYAYAFEQATHHRKPPRYFATAPV